MPKDDQVAQFRLPAAGTQLTPRECEDVALAVAWQGVGRVSPNPMVGAVIVDGDHRLLAAGAHLEYGRDHAEIHALNEATGGGKRPLPKGAVLYVTLEPCAHDNRTPACAPQLARAGFSRIVYGARDPNPLVNGKGVAMVEHAGIQCEQDPAWSAECHRLAETFFHNVETGRPFVGLKTATSLDGVIARKGDERAWITGERARTYGHFLRVYYDAVMVGAQTAISDNPRLDARDARVPGRVPTRVVIDPTGEALRCRGADQWRMLESRSETVVWMTAPRRPAAEEAESRRRLTEMGVRFVEIQPDGHGELPADEILRVLYAEGVRSVLLEGGAGLYQPFLNAGQVHRLHLFQAPTVLGGHSSIHWSAGTAALPGERLGDVTVTPLGDDWVIEAEFPRGRAGDES